ncbi:hypothetical protein PoB_000158300 [Plakobranchus ocellatus]|uniref:Uncharacterized protein n=1 Tax=Plakobranchus ocellatus TaxID=259542 RepID=A0AAV3XXI3_9GAST|nr:hypothetical protein PoB_000158300 [Plakobranchus ocellatus]
MLFILPFRRNEANPRPVNYHQSLDLQKEIHLKQLKQNKSTLELPLIGACAESSTRYRTLGCSHNLCVERTQGQNKTGNESEEVDMNWSHQIYIENIWRHLIQRLSTEHTRTYISRTLYTPCMKEVKRESRVKSQKHGEYRRFFPGTE